MRRVLAVLVLTGAALANPGLPTRSADQAGAERLLDLGFDHLYHLRFAEARSAFRAAGAVPEKAGMAAAGEAASHLFEEFERHGVLTTGFLLDNETLLGGIRGVPDPSRMEAFHKASQRVRTVASARLNAEPADKASLLALTLAAGMEADAAALVEKRQLEALKRIREAEGLARRLIELDPAQGDAFMALGAANYIVGSMPLFKRAVLWVGGVKGDRVRGMAELERAATRGRFLAPYAKMLLALACIREKQAERGLRLLGELIEAFPASPLFKREKPHFEAAARAGR